VQTEFNVHRPFRNQDCCVQGYGFETSRLSSYGSMEFETSCSFKIWVKLWVNVHRPTVGSGSKTPRRWE
jgi:hypothetical protein